MLHGKNLWMREQFVCNSRIHSSRWLLQLTNDKETLSELRNLALWHPEKAFPLVTPFCRCSPFQLSLCVICSFLHFTGGETEDEMNWDSVTYLRSHSHWVVELRSPRVSLGSQSSAGRIFTKWSALGWQFHLQLNIEKRLLFKWIWACWVWRDGIVYF